LNTVEPRQHHSTDEPQASEVAFQASCSVASAGSPLHTLFGHRCRDELFGGGLDPELCRWFGGATLEASFSSQKLFHATIEYVFLGQSRLCIVKYNNAFAIVFYIEFRYTTYLNLGTHIQPLHKIASDNPI
jgi:hypothetical protein